MHEADLMCGLDAARRCIRNIARSLPVGMKLVVKEHPASVGYRGTAYYRKLLEIPGVVLAAPDLSSRALVLGAELVFVISGSVAMESLMLGKPVIHFGNAPFSFLPDTMIRKVGDPETLPYTVLRMLNEHEHDERALMAFLHAIETEGVAVDFYSSLLGRRGVHRVDGEGDEARRYRSNVERLAGYLARVRAHRGRQNPMARTY